MFDYSIWEMLMPYLHAFIPYVIAVSGLTTISILVIWYLIKQMYYCVTGSE